MRREQDSLNPRTHANVMVPSPEDDPSTHSYCYARIVGIYHAALVSMPHSKNLAVWKRTNGLVDHTKKIRKAQKSHTNPITFELWEQRSNFRT